MAIKDLGNGKFRIDLRIGGRRGTRHRTTIEATAAQAKEAHTDLLRAARGITSSGGTGATLRDAYVNAMALKWGDHKDRKGITDRWRVLTSILPDETRLAEIDSARIVELLNKLRARKISATTINKYLSLLRVLFEEASRCTPALIHEDDVPRIPHLKAQQKKRRPLRGDEQERVLAWLASHPEEKMVAFLDFVVFSMDMGSRLSETLGLRARALDLSAPDCGEVTFLAVKNGDAERCVPLTERVRNVIDRRLAAWLQAGRPGNPRIFEDLKAGTAQKRWTIVRRALDMPDISIHCLRHTAGKRIIDETGDLRAAQEWLGHRDIATTVRYTKVDKQKLRDVARRLSVTTHVEPETDTTRLRMLPVKQASDL
jgi:integrase/recombinase XerC